MTNLSFCQFKFFASNIHHDTHSCNDTCTNYATHTHSHTIAHTYAMTHALTNTLIPQVVFIKLVLPHSRRHYANDAFLDDRGLVLGI